MTTLTIKAEANKTRDVVRNYFEQNGSKSCIKDQELIDACYFGKLDILKKKINENPSLLTSLFWIPQKHFELYNHYDDDSSKTILLSSFKEKEFEEYMTDNQQSYNLLHTNLLSICCYKCHFDLIKFIIEYAQKNNIHSFDIDGYPFSKTSPLTLTLQDAADSSSKQMQIVKYLLRNGADPNFGGLQHREPICETRISLDNDKIASFLIERGGNYAGFDMSDYETLYGSTAYDGASQNISNGIIKRKLYLESMYKEIKIVIQPIISDLWKVVAFYCCNEKHIKLIQNNKYPLDECDKNEYDISWWTPCGCDMNTRLKLPQLSSGNINNKKRKYQEMRDDDNDNNNNNNKNTKFMKTNQSQRVPM